MSIPFSPTLLPDPTAGGYNNHWTRKIEDFFTWASKMGVSVAVRKTPNAVGVGNIEIPVEQEHAERLVQAGGKDKALLGSTGLVDAA